MEIKFLSVTIEGFLSVGEPCTIDLTKDGITLVKGYNKNPLDNARSNGSGKSTIFEAIYYALTGYTVRGIKGKDVVNRNYPVGCSVELILSKNGTEYKIVRSRNHQVKGTNVELYSGEDNLSGRTLRSSEDIIYEYFPELSVNIIGSILILGQGLPNKLTNYSPSGRKQLLEELSGTGSLINELSTKLDGRKSELKSKISEIDKQIMELNGKLSVYSSIIKDNNTVLDEYEYVDVTQSISKLDSELSQYESGLNSLSDESSTSKTMLRSLLDSLSLIKSELHTKTSEISNINNNINKLGSGVCPTCNRPFDNINELIKEKEDLRVKLGKCNAELSELNGKYTDMQLKYQECEIYNNELDYNIKEFNNKIQLLNIEKVKLQNINNKLSEAKSIISNYNSKVEEINSNITKLKLDLENNIKHYDAISYLSRITSKEFKTYMLSSVIEYLNERVQYYSKKFFSEGRVKVYANGNSIEIEVGSKPYESLSGGEAQKVDLSLQFAMRDMLVALTGLHCNLLSLDEVFDNLDEVGCNTLLSIISDDLSSIDSVYIITHHADIDIPHDHEIEVVKNNMELSVITQLEI